MPDIAMAKKVLEGARPPLAELAPHAPPKLVQLLEHMIDGDPKKRPQSAGELVSRFAELAIDISGSNLYEVQKDFAFRVAEPIPPGPPTEPMMAAAVVPESDPPEAADTDTDPPPKLHEKHEDKTAPSTPKALMTPTEQLPVEHVAPIAQTTPEPPNTTSKRFLGGALVIGIPFALLVAVGAWFVTRAIVTEETAQPGTTTTDIQPVTSVDNPPEEPIRAPIDTQNEPTVLDAGQVAPADAGAKTTEAESDAGEAEERGRRSDTGDREERPELSRVVVVVIPDGTIDIDGHRHNRSRVVVWLSPGWHTAIAQNGSHRQRRRFRVHSGRTTEVMMRIP